MQAIVIEDFREERLPRRGPRGRGERSLVLEHFPALRRAIATCSNLVALVRSDYSRTIGAYRSATPRTQSRVHRRVDRPAGEVLSRLSADDLVLAVGPSRLTACPKAARYDAIDHEYRIPCTLSLRWSWPALPMWLAVGELSSTRCAIGLLLRSHRRVRYPVRYFHVAHAVLSKLESRLR
jgi:hypothetical protein